MKIGGPNGVGAAPAASARSASSAGGFSVSSAEAGAEVAASARLAATPGVSSIDALLALQEVEGSAGRRRKAVRRAGVILDVLDELKVAVLEGGIAPATLDRLIEAVRQERARTGDERLEGVLDEIETRAAVELAKLEQPAHAA